MSDANEQPKWLDNNSARHPEQLGVNERGDWVYPSQLAEGFEEIEIPSESLNASESLHMRDFGPHVASKIESSMKTGYLRKQGPVEVLKHYTAMVKELKLMDEGALKRLEGLASDFEKEPEREEFFKQVVRPYLHSLTPKRR